MLARTLNAIEVVTFDYPCKYFQVFMDTVKSEKDSYHFSGLSRV